MIRRPKTIHDELPHQTNHSSGIPIDYLEARIYIQQGDLPKIQYTINVDN